MLKHLKIKYKILLGILLTTLISEIILTTVALVGVLNVKNNFFSLNEVLTNEILSKSSIALKDQSLKYIDSISLKQVEKFNSILYDIQLDTSSIALGMKNIYDNKNNFKGIKILDPSETKLGDINDVYSASSKIYSVGGKGNKKKNEMAILSNAEFLVKPLYINNYNVDSIYIGTESEICYNYSVYNDIERFLPSSQKWYIDAVNAFRLGKEEAVWQSAYVDPTTKRRSIMCSKAFADNDGNILGVVCIETFIDTMYNEINSQDVKDLGFIFVVDNEDRVIMNSDNVDSENLKNFSELLKSKSDIPKEVSLKNENYVVSSNLISSTGWNFFILSSENELTSLTDNLSSQINDLSEESVKYVNLTLLYLLIIFIIVFFIIIVLSSIVANFIAKKITKPIEKLSEEAVKVGRGVFKRKIKIDSNDEIGELKDSFNKMTKDLVVYMNKFRRTTKEKERINNELKIAEKIQKSMLPAEFQSLTSSGYFDIFAIMKPAKMVGGDFYDFFLLDDEHLAVVIGDVSGKGIAAALFMVIVKTLIKNQITNGFSPEKVFDMVNKQLIENNDTGMFATAFIGVLDLTTGEFIFSNAGHNKPLIYKNNEGFNWLNTSPCFVLGGMDSIKYRLERLKLSSMDMIYLYTDGVTESFDVNDNLFSDERLKSVLNELEIKNLGAKSVISSVNDVLKDFTKGKEQSDDITMLVLKYFGKNNSK